VREGERDDQDLCSGNEKAVEYTHCIPVADLAVVSAGWFNDEA
jgi:hypothetical protein